MSSDPLARTRDELRTVQRLLRDDPSLDMLCQAVGHYRELSAQINSLIAKLLTGRVRAEIRLAQAIDNALERGNLTHLRDIAINDAELDLWRKRAVVGEPACAEMLGKAAATATEQGRSITAPATRS